jgi:2-dehydro-3-deoxygluconokinase
MGLWGSDRRRELVLPFVERCDLLFAGAAELSEILGEASDDLRTIATRARERGPSEVVVRGHGGVGVLDRDGAWHALDTRRDAAVDPIGAGDAFNAGYIAVRINGGTIESALTAGVRCGAAVTTAMSDTAAFPRSI